MDMFSSLIDAMVRFFDGGFAFQLCEMIAETRDRQDAKVVWDTRFSPESPGTGWEPVSAVTYEVTSITHGRPTSPRFTVLWRRRVTT